MMMWLPRLFHTDKHVAIKIMSTRKGPLAQEPAFLGISNRTNGGIGNPRQKETKGAAVAPEPSIKEEGKSTSIRSFIDRSGPHPALHGTLASPSVRRITIFILWPFFLSVVGLRGSRGVFF